MKYTTKLHTKINAKFNTNKYTKNLAISLAIAFVSMEGANALEFGGMGNVSAGMGGAGVALKQSQWALYYNPALLGVVNKSSFAYSFGAGYKETNLLGAAGIDTDNIEKMGNQLSSLFSGNGTGVTTSTQSVQGRNASQPNTQNTQISGLSSSFEAVLKDFTGNTSGNPTTEDLAKTLSKLAGGTGTETDVSKAWAEVQKNGKIDEVKKSLQDSIKKQNDTDGSLGLLSGLIDSLDESSIGSVINTLGKGEKIDLTKMLGSGGITLKASSNDVIKKFLRDMESLFNMLNQNDFSVSSQNGLIITYSGKNNNWGISLGLLASAYANANAKIDENHKRLIITQDSTHIEVSAGKDSVTVKQVNGNTNSALSKDANHQISASTLAVAEVPLGYGYAFHTRFGTFGLGIAGKYIHAGGYVLESSGGYDTIAKNISFSTKDIVQTSTWGVDAGLLYMPSFSKNLIFGVVGKNLNAPKIKTNKKTIELNTQVRAGVSYSLWKERVVFALDADLLANETLSSTRPYSQMIGGGVMFDFKYVDFRFGSMYDFRDTTKEGVILTGGINILGFLDIAVQSNLNLTPMPMVSNSLKLPSYLNVKIGGGFSW
ncbi:conjugal transfer protein TraF [Helicobacter sp. T3_23-1056]